ncbi:MAG: hypothetical protein A3I05_09780 [Deltaproteobacteria bacterium RIFCSPLOWO2_02_FULL_44_10]|nr:MAG: hypothetical protein A3C46_09405 [Deltaproteobacteria bacterium RIFCSPHIGHO2_02_FULL_44_16]OGQ44984.1 MAG: hypothetical protein A3I05_09780 [Deltaproteobacteria bacterium RIFCSPLOWO2_02_FULL_44_10]
MIHDPFDFVDEGLLQKLRPVFQFLYSQYFRVTVTGEKNIPQKGKVLLVANHSGMLPYDGAMVHLAVFNTSGGKRRVRFLVDDFVFHLPFLGDFIQRIGGVRASHENATTLLCAGECVAIFPEGVKGVGKLYDDRYQLDQFGHGGFVKLAMRTKTTIIPTTIVGAEEIHPILYKEELLAQPLGIPYIPITPTFPWLGPLGLIPLPSKWHIHFGKPISFTKEKKSDAENEKLVEKKSEDIRKTIQTTIHRLLKKRKSIWY